uniref:Phosphagen kinase C-terminal domain-containing protein n=1 Tax=Ditylum brightwellii TaxID=49249 RepID=A0A7S2EAS7_9STRA
MIRLGQCPGFNDMVKRLKLRVRRKHLGDLNVDYEGVYDQNRQHGGKKRYTGIFDVSNVESLGKSETHLINTMIIGVGRLIELELKLERGESVDCAKIGWD